MSREVQRSPTPASLFYVIIRPFLLIPFLVGAVVRIYLIRHADPDYPNNTITPAGHIEARALAEHLVDAEIDEIYASPVNRAGLTAGYIAERLKLPVTVEPW